jgi:hypothetical protein
MAGSFLLEPLNLAFNPANAEDYAVAQAVVANAASCPDAVDGLRAAPGPVHDASPEVFDAGRAVVEALPPALSAALLAAVRSGLELGVLVELHWDQAAAKALGITEGPAAGDPVEIHLSHPSDGIELSS